MAQDDNGYTQRACFVLVPYVVKLLMVAPSAAISRTTDIGGCAGHACMLIVALSNLRETTPLTCLLALPFESARLVYESQFVLNVDALTIHSR